MKQNIPQEIFIEYTAEGTVVNLRLIYPRTNTKHHIMQDFNCSMCIRNYALYKLKSPLKCIKYSVYVERFLGGNLNKTYSYLPLNLYCGRRAAAC